MKWNEYKGREGMIIGVLLMMILIISSSTLESDTNISIEKDNPPQASSQASPQTQIKTQIKTQINTQINTQLKPQDGSSKSEQAENYIADSAASKAGTMQRQRQNQRKNDKVAFAVKTGIAIIEERTPILFKTYLNNVKNKFFILEAPRGKIQNVDVVDVLSNLYTGLKDENGNDLTTHHLAEKEKTINQDLGIIERIPNEESDGWKSDAHKNLPGFRALLDRFPDSEWYMMVDDDTYVFLDNLYDFLAPFNSSLPYYFGAGNTFTKCDKIENWKYSTIFAHGGSGIVISRGAMLRLKKVWEFCIIRYHDCWAGDVRVGLCLRNEGVLLTNIKTFHTNPPNERTVYSHPCSRPLTFHHLLGPQIQKLHDLYMDRKSKDSYVTMEDLLLEWADASPRKDTDREGDEFQVSESDSLASCIDVCKANPKCFAYSFQNNQCSLKSKVNALKQKPGSTSGILVSNFQCKPGGAEVALEMDIGLKRSDDLDPIGRDSNNLKPRRSCLRTLLGS